MSINSSEKKVLNLEQKKDKIKLFGFNLSNLDPTYLFLLFSISHIAFSCIFAGLQEKVTMIKGFRYVEFMTIIQTLTYCICAFIEMMCAKGELGHISTPKAPIKNYVILSLYTVAGMFFTNYGLHYLSYPTRIVFKSAKPIPTMILEFLYVGKLFNKLEILSVTILTLGIIFFSSGEARGNHTFPLYGILLMILGVTFDSLTSNYEKKHIFNHKASHAEAMFYASLFGIILSLVPLLMEYNQFLEAISFFIYTPEALLWLFISSIGGYLSVTFILLLIKLYSATFAECVKGFRKVTSIFFSYTLLSDGNKAFTKLHGYGMICFLISMALTMYDKSDYNKSSYKLKVEKKS